MSKNTQNKDRFRLSIPLDIDDSSSNRSSKSTSSKLVSQSTRSASQTSTWKPVSQSTQSASQTSTSSQISNVSSNKSSKFGSGSIRIKNIRLPKSFLDQDRTGTEVERQPEGIDG